jgi:hypothetical protein
MCALTARLQGPLKTVLESPYTMYEGEEYRTRTHNYARYRSLRSDLAIDQIALLASGHQIYFELSEV